MKNPENNLSAFDIGNSRIKALYKDQLTPFKYDSWEDNLEQYLSNPDYKPDLIAISSVNEKIKKRLISLLNKFDLKFIESGELINSQNIIDLSDITGMGQDRILGLFGALEISAPPLITIDCGTAITINVLDEDYKCRGGVIFAGPYSQLKSLSENTEGLYEVELLSKPLISARNTNDALANGILYGIEGAIIHIIHKIREQEFNKLKVPIIITGGGASLITPMLDQDKILYTFDKNLVPKGSMSLLKKST